MVERNRAGRTKQSLTAKLDLARGRLSREKAPAWTARSRSSSSRLHRRKDRDEEAAKTTGAVVHWNDCGTTQGEGGGNAQVTKSLELVVAAGARTASKLPKRGRGQGERGERGRETHNWSSVGISCLRPLR